MTWFDFGVLIVLVVSVVISLFHGLVREMISLGGWVGGFILAMFFGGHVAGLLPQSLSPLMSGLIGFLLVFASVLVIVVLAGLTPLPREPFWSNALLSKPFETAAQALRPYLPEGLARRLRYRG